MRYIYLFLFSLISTLSNAQESAAANILVIPFNPDYYFSDADHQLSERNAVSVPEIRDRFRSGLQLSLQTRIFRQVGIKSESLLVTREELKSDDLLDQIYSGVSYKMSQPKVPFLQEQDPQQGEETAKDKVKKWLQLPDKKVKQEEGRDLGLNFSNPERQYMHAQVRHPEMLSFLFEEYGTQYFLFVNQFELITNYEHCLDRAVDNFERSVRVHFTLYDKEGKWLYGNAVTMTTDTRAMKTHDIIDENCIPIANFIAEQIPKPGAVSAAP